MASQLDRPFEVMPAELVLEVMKNMGVRELTSFVLSNKRLFGIFKENQASVMTTVLLRLVELEPLLLLYTIGKRDFARHAMLHPRRISVDIGRGPDNHVNLLQCFVGFRDGKLICPRKIVLETRDLTQIWNMVKVVDWWVEEYPRLRWHKNPEDSRCLRSSEEVRLRKAVTRWWLYSECFHGQYPCDRLMPRMLQTDPRLHHLRLLSSIELRELDDLWETVRSTVQRDICSSISVQVSPQHGDCHPYQECLLISILQDWKPVPWGWEDWRSKDIVHTYLKLDPAQLGHLIKHATRLGKAGIIRTARQSQPDFSADQESLSWCIDTVLQERVLLKSNGVADIPSSGIVDEDSFSDDKGMFTTDSWLTGKPPLSKQEILSYPVFPQKHTAYGDDGRDFDHYP